MPGAEWVLTLFGGLPVPIATCAHGTGYDIVGRGEANPQGLRNALALCRRMAP